MRWRKIGLIFGSEISMYGIESSQIGESWGVHNGVGVCEDLSEGAVQVNAMLLSLTPLAGSQSKSPAMVR